MATSFKRVWRVKRPPTDLGDLSYFDLPLQAFSAASPFFLMNLVTPSATGANANLNSPGWNTLGSVGTATDAASSPPAATPALHCGPSPPFGIDPPRPPRDGLLGRTTTSCYAEKEQCLQRSLLEMACTLHQVDERARGERCFVRIADVFTVCREAISDAADAESLFVGVGSCTVSTEASSSFFFTPYEPRAATDTKLYGEISHAHEGKHDASKLHKLFHHAKLRLKKHKSKNWHDEDTLDDAQAPGNDDQAHHDKAIPGLGKTGTWLREEFGNGKKTMKIFGRAPWSRKDSSASFGSVSSSIRDVLRGDTPPASPLLADNAAYVNHIWMSNTFPGGEAVRVSTPPMDEDTADGRPRGFFGPLTPPQPETTGSQTFLTPMTSVHASPKYNAHRMSLAVPSREWWEAKPQKPVRHGETSSAAKFEFDVPEHLPNSPMCPANARHKSGGTGLCVYHGRRRALSTVRDESSRRRDSGSTS
ncbi:hypothetical protein LLEC1_02951 [Akanthomyces lecanii]|uniref:Uncharacterized protein n=1 Tax=Cordyceps confragosa TaxID=2714763 RepID=A0A179I715_CORDF|nr:hypothetical protein LLEC1_02951 [Akanthomyces lecanii]